VPALGELVEVNELGVRLLRPAPRSRIEFVGEDAYGGRDHDALDGEERRLKSAYVASVKWPGRYYLGPQDIEEEEEEGQLLLHPYFDEPRDHIMFGMGGIEAARQINGTTSERGLRSIEVYELYASELRRARQDQQSIAWNQYWTAYHNAVGNGQTPEQARAAGRAAIEQRLGVNPPYSVAIEDFIKLYTA
jgi:hypothetical protein